MSLKLSTEDTVGNLSDTYIIKVGDTISGETRK